MNCTNCGKNLMGQFCSYCGHPQSNVEHTDIHMNEDISISNVTLHDSNDASSSDESNNIKMINQSGKLYRLCSKYSITGISIAVLLISILFYVIPLDGFSNRESYRIFSIAKEINFDNIILILYVAVFLCQAMNKQLYASISIIFLNTVFLYMNSYEKLWYNTFDCPMLKISLHLILLLNALVFFIPYIHSSIIIYQDKNKLSLTTCLLIAYISLFLPWVSLDKYNDSLVDLLCDKEVIFILAICMTILFTIALLIDKHIIKVAKILLYTLCALILYFLVNGIMIDGGFLSIGFWAFAASIVYATITIQTAKYVKIPKTKLAKPAEIIPMNNISNIEVQRSDINPAKIQRLLGRIQQYLLNLPVELYGTVSAILIAIFYIIPGKEFNSNRTSNLYQIISSSEIKIIMCILLAVILLCYYFKKPLFSSCIVLIFNYLVLYTYRIEYETIHYSAYPMLKYLFYGILLLTTLILFLPFIHPKVNYSIISNKLEINAFRFMILCYLTRMLPWLRYKDLTLSFIDMMIINKKTPIIYLSIMEISLFISAYCIYKKRLLASIIVLCIQCLLVLYHCISSIYMVGNVPSIGIFIYIYFLLRTLYLIMLDKHLLTGKVMTE